MSADPPQPGRARDAAASEAARRAVEPERLLPGEDAGSRYRDDAAHWIEVYSELLAFKGFLIEGAAARAKAMSTPAARAEVEATDLRIARAEAERLARRLAFWRRRQEEAGAAS